MKFNIYGFNQEILIQEYSTLNGNDIIVLRVLVDLLPRMTRSIIIDGEVYKQVTYEILLQDVPFVTQSESTLKKIVKKLIDSGLIERKIVNRNGKYTYFKVTDKLLVLDNGLVQHNENIDCNEEDDRDLEDRIEYIEQVLLTRANHAIVNELKKFKDQYEFFGYFDDYILPDKMRGKKNTCNYMLKNLKLYFNEV